MNLKKLLLSLDTLLALLAASAVSYICPERISPTIAASFYEVAISVASVVFSIFFAALAFIASSSDDDYVRFLKTEGVYSEMLENFAWTLKVLLLTLILSLLAFAYTLISSSSDEYRQSKWLLVTITFLLTYGLVACSYIAGDAMKYARFRLEFMEIDAQQREESSVAVGSISSTPSLPPDKGLP